MNVNDLIAIDVHTHAEVSCRQEPDEAWAPFEAASAKYFKAGKRPTIAETIAYHRERRIGLMMFTVDSEFELGASISIRPCRVSSPMIGSPISSTR